MSKIKYFGMFWDENGEYLGKQPFKRHQKEFKFKNGTYLVKLKEGSYFERKGIFINKRYYLYNIKQSHPIKMNNKSNHYIDPEDFSTLLETNQLKKLNDVNKKGLQDLLTPKNIIIAIVVIAGFVLLSTGGLTP